MQEQDINTVIWSANDAWNHAFNQADATGLSGLYAADATLSAGDGRILEGRTAIRDLFQAFFDNGLHSHAISPRSSAISEDHGMIYQVAEWQAFGLAAEDGQQPVFGGILMSVLVRQPDGEWMIASHVWNMES